MPPDDRPVTKGKTAAVKSTKPKSPRPNLQTEFHTTATSLLRVVGRLQRLMSDDRWPRHRHQMAVGWDADIERAQQILSRLRAELTPSPGENDTPAPQEHPGEQSSSEGEVHV